MFKPLKKRELIGGVDCVDRLGRNVKFRESPWSCRKCANGTYLPLTVPGADASMAQPGRENFYHLAEFRGEFSYEWPGGRASERSDAVPYASTGSGVPRDYRRHRQTGAGFRPNRTHTCGERSRQAFIWFPG